MTDPSTTALAEQTSSLAGGDLPAGVAEATIARLVDVLGCAIGGLDSPPARVAAALAAQQTGNPCARLLGSGRATTPELAAFANGVAARYLDFNDTYTGKSAGHPSDMIPALLAVAESVSADGDALVRSIVAGYEVFGAIGRTVPIRSRGWDQGTLVVLGTAAGASLLLGLGPDETAHAISLAATMAVPTRSTRAGALSMWKGAATAASARFGVFAAQLAAGGMTGPDQAIEGKDGLWQQVTGRFDVPEFGDGGWAVARSAIKQFPLEYNAQIGVEIMRSLHGTVSPDAVESIAVETYWTAFDEIGNEPEKWDPHTRETADHSLPYLLAVALIDGRVDQDSFDEPHLTDPAVRALMARVTAAEDPAMTAQWPATVPCRITVTANNKRIVRAEAFPLGHPERPLPAAELREKFTGLVAPRFGEEAAQLAFERLGEVRELADAGRIIDLFTDEKIVSQEKGASL